MVDFTPGNASPISHRMKFGRPLREPVRVIMHINGGFTRVSSIRTESQDGGVNHHIDIPTQKIPQHLRRVGSRFLVVLPGIIPEEQDSASDMRAALGQLAVHELTGSETFTDGQV